MTSLFVIRHPNGVYIYTSLPDREARVIGDVAVLLAEGEAFGGLSYAQLEEIADTTGMIDSDDLNESI